MAQHTNYPNLTPLLTPSHFNNSPSHRRRILRADSLDSITSLSETHSRPPTPQTPEMLPLAKEIKAYDTTHETCPNGATHQPQSHSTLVGTYDKYDRNQRTYGAVHSPTIQHPISNHKAQGNIHNTEPLTHISTLSSTPYSHNDDINEVTPMSN